jgi:hypothetical protein
VTTDERGVKDRQSLNSMCGREGLSQGEFDQWGLRRLGKQRPIVWRQFEGVGEEAHCFKARSGALAAFQVTDRASTDPRARGKLFLTQRGTQAQATDEGTKGV